jgi:transport and golgi organization protein 1
MQNVTLENRAHEAWLNARQAERKLEEARSEASALRRKLTSMAEVPGGGGMGNAALDDINNMPSPIRVESPNHPPPMMMPPFMPPPPFMAGLPGIPPPSFMPPGIPPFMPSGPSGRLMSPPPPPNRYSPNMHSRDRDYSPERSGRYSPADSRYNYSVMSPYETETDFSPPPSPPRQNYSRDSRDYRDGPRGSGHFGKKAYSPPPTKSATNRSSKTKGKNYYSDDDSEITLFFN